MSVESEKEELVMPIEQLKKTINNSHKAGLCDEKGRPYPKTDRHKKCLLVLYTPAFVERNGPPSKFEFDDYDEMLQIPTVKCHKEKNGFHRFSIDGGEGKGRYLMAEYDNGKEWYVVGYIRGPMNLPKWEAVYD